MDILDTEIRLFGVANDSIVDGPGLRYSVYTQGCPHHCAGCHNPESWAFDGGQVTTLRAIISDIKSNRLIKDVTISGGDPFCQSGPVSILVQHLKRQGYCVWIYSGWKLEELEEESSDDKTIADILGNVDVLVDGRFEEDKKSLDLKWKGSSNQRVIDMNKTRKEGHIVLYEEFSFDDEIPPNW